MKHECSLTESGRGIATESDETRVHTGGQQLEPVHGDGRRNVSFTDASSRTCLLLDNADTARPLSWRLTSATCRLLRQAASQWRKSRNSTSRSAGDVEPNRHIACVAESYVLDATCYTSRQDLECASESSSAWTAGSRQQPSHEPVMFENRAYDGGNDVTGCDAAVDNVQPGTSTQNTLATAATDDCRQVSSGYLADTELDNVDWRHDPDTGTTTSSLPLPVSSVYLGLSRLRGGRTVRLVWRTATAAVTSACVVCCLHIYSMLGVFGVLSNDRPASSWPWLSFQTIYR